MSAKDVVNGINIAFRVLSGTISGFTWVVEHLMHSWDEFSGAIVQGWHDIRQWTLDAWHAIDQVFHNIVHAYDNVEHAGDNFSGAIATVLKDVEHFFENLWTTVDRVGTEVVSWFRELPGKILSARLVLSGRCCSALVRTPSACPCSAAWHPMVGNRRGHERHRGGRAGSVGPHPALPGEERPPVGQRVAGNEDDPAGRKVATMFASGMTGGSPAVTAAAAVLARAAGISGSGSAAAGGTGELVLRFEATGNALIDAIGNGLRGYVRTHGGAGTSSVQRALGQTA